jgi:hypothetical protein
MEAKYSVGFLQRFSGVTAIHFRINRVTLSSVIRIRNPVLQILSCNSNNQCDWTQHRGRCETTEKVVFLSHYSHVVTVKLYELE